MKVFFCGQCTDVWWDIRRGIPTSSEFDRIITPKKGDLSDQSVGYIAQLIADLVNPAPNYFCDHGPARTAAMDHGTETEPAARHWLTQRADLDIKEVGFIVNDDFTLGASPDGVIGLEFNPVADPEPWRKTDNFAGHPYFSGTLAATLELKCPMRATHVGYLMGGELPVKYKPQVHGHMVVTGAAYVEFVSYTNDLRPLRIRVERDAYTDKVERATKDFIGEYLKALELVGVAPPKARAA